MSPLIPTGFDGLLSFVTDADSAIAESDRIAAGPRPAPAPKPQSEPPVGTVDRDGGAFFDGIKKVGGWVLAIGLVLAIKACFFAGTRAVVDGTSSSSYNQDATQDHSASSDDGTGATDTASSNDITAEDAAISSDDGATASSGTNFDNESGTVSEPVAGPFDESKPAPGIAMLTMAEMQYCLAEDIRLSGQKTEMESLKYSDSDKFNRNVDDFNAVVSDYNSVCVRRQIVASQRSTAETNVNGRRYLLESEGRSRVQ